MPHEETLDTGSTVVFGDPAPITSTAPLLDDIWTVYEQLPELFRTAVSLPGDYADGMVRMEFRLQDDSGANLTNQSFWLSGGSAASLDALQDPQALQGSQAEDVLALSYLDGSSTVVPLQPDDGGRELLRSIASFAPSATSGSFSSTDPINVTATPTRLSYSGPLESREWSVAQPNSPSILQDQIVDQTTNPIVFQVGSSFLDGVAVNPSDSSLNDAIQLDWVSSASDQLTLASTPASFADLDQQTKLLLTSTVNLGPLDHGNIRFRGNLGGTDVWLNFTLSDHHSTNNNWSTRWLGASNDATADQSLYTYEFEINGSWEYGNLYNRLSQGQSGDLFLEQIDFRQAADSTWRYLNSSQLSGLSSFKLSVTDSLPDLGYSVTPVALGSLLTQGTLSAEDWYQSITSDSYTTIGSPGLGDLAYISSPSLGAEPDGQNIRAWFEYRGNTGTGDIYLRFNAQYNDQTGKWSESSSIDQWSIRSYLDSLEGNTALSDDVVFTLRGYGVEFRDENELASAHFSKYDWGSNNNFWISGQPMPPANPYADKSVDDYLSPQFQQFTLTGLRDLLDHRAAMPASLALIDYPGSEALAFSYELTSGADALTQLAVLGDSVEPTSHYTLNIYAESLRDSFAIEAVDFTISFDPDLFGAIDPADVRIGAALPIANAVSIDNTDGLIRIAGASLADLSRGSGIGDASTLLASISLDFDEVSLANLPKNPDGSLTVSPLSFSVTANRDETTFSQEFTDGSNQLNRRIATLRDLGGRASVSGQEVTLYEAKINLTQQGDGFVVGTDRVIGADAAFTNLVRSGDTVTASANWLNAGNIQANNIVVEGIANSNALLVDHRLSASSLASGSFVNGVFMTDSQESLVLDADFKITGAAGSVVDLSAGILNVRAEGSDIFTNAGKGSKNLITFQGDLNYDGRVSMKDLAYLNAGAARQQLVEGADENGNAVQVASEASYARDVDADFNGVIDLADLAILDADWGKSLHVGDQQFTGTADLSWESLDRQGAAALWDNTSFKAQNAIEASAAYVGSLEGPGAIGVIGGDGNTTPNDGGLQGSEFQDPLTV